MSRENVETVQRIYDAYVAVYTLQDGKVTRAVWFTHRDDALKAAGLGDSART